MSFNDVSCTIAILVSFSCVDGLNKIPLLFVFLSSFLLMDQIPFNVELCHGVSGIVWCIVAHVLTSKRLQIALCSPFCVIMCVCERVITFLGRLTFVNRLF